jgi:multidrug efflux pump subunit AcrA (membrane-fusion protein)
MPTEINNTIRSEAVKEIISNKPSFVVRYGISFFFVILCLVAIVCWFIKYPDMVNTKALLTSVNAPKPVVTNISGKLIKLAIKENDSVTKGQIIGYIEATANHEEILQLAQKVKQVEQLLANNKSEAVQPFFENNFTQLGELQPGYQTLSQAFLNFKNYLSNGFYLKKKTMLATDMINIKRLHTNLF